MPKRTVDTSHLYRSMSGKSSENQRSSPGVSAAAPAAEGSFLADTEEKSSVLEPDQEVVRTASDSRPASPADGKISPAEPKKRNRRSMSETDDSGNPAVKIGAYLSPTIHEALMLHCKYDSAVGGRYSVSKAINTALEQFLSKELEILADVDKNLSNDARIANGLFALLNLNR